jgi:hypothetical protein
MIQTLLAVHGHEQFFTSPLCQRVRRAIAGEMPCDQLLCDVELPLPVEEAGVDCRYLSRKIIEPVAAFDKTDQAYEVGSRREPVDDR